MNVLYNYEELLKLASDLYEVSGIWVNVHDGQGNYLELRDMHSSFCALINQDTEGHNRCCQCDNDAAALCHQKKIPYHYQCHAGLGEVMIPVFDHGELIANITYGQFLSAEDPDLQWKKPGSCSPGTPGIWTC